MIAQRIDDASKSQYKLKYDDPETTRLASDIREASRSLSINVSKMKDNLDSFVSVLEKIQVTVKRQKERSLAERILGWLKSLFKAITRIFATLFSPISGFLLYSADPRVRESAFAASTLRKAAATFSAADSGAFFKHIIILLCQDGSDRLFDAEPQEGKESESLDSVILFLKEIVPREAQIAQNKLERFDEVLYIMGLDSSMRAGRRVTLYGPDPSAVAKEWRDVAKQYQLVLPDDEDPAS